MARMLFDGFEPSEDWEPELRDDLKQILDDIPNHIALSLSRSQAFRKAYLMAVTELACNQYVYLRQPSEYLILWKN